jgi:hypothetical protein
MGKVLKVVATIGIAVGIAVLAAPTGGLSLALAGALSVSTAVASAIIATGLSLVASLAMRAIAGKPSTQSSAASPQTFRQSITNARIIYGMRRAGGVIVFFHPRQVGKVHYRYFVVAIAGHRCAGAARFFLNDEAVTVDGAGKVTSGPYAGAGWLWFERGNENAQANATFVAECAPKWTAEHRGRGVAKLYAKFEMTDAAVQAGLPNMTVEVLGKDDVRDPRTGDRGYMRNAAAVFYDWLAMPRAEGGFGAYPDEMPDDAWLSAQCNVSDERVPLRAGGTEERYAFDSMIEVGAAPSEIRQSFVLCCAGTYTYSGGRHLMRPGYWVPVSATLEENDLAGPISVPLLAEEGEIANEVLGTFVDPSTLYQPQPVPTRSVAGSALTIDDVRQADYDLPHITSHPRGQRILEIMLRRANAELRVTWPMNVVGLAVAAMDTVQVRTARYGLSNYAFTTANWGLSPDFGVVLGLKEESPEFYDWNVGMELLPGEVPTLARAEPIGDTVPGSEEAAIANSYPVNLTITATDAGAITISNHVRRYIDGHADVAIGGTMLASGLAPGEFRAIAYDDPGRVGGAVVYGLYAADLDARVSSAHPGRHYVGYAFIPTAGSPPASGGGATPPGGYCVTTDTPILMADRSIKPAGDVVVGDKLYTRHEVTLHWGIYPVEAIEIVDSDDVWEAAIGGRKLSATGDHLVYTGTWVKMRDLGVKIADAAVVKMTVTGAHTYVSNGVLSHNIKNQSEQIE